MAENFESLSIQRRQKRQKEQEILLSCIEKNQKTVSHNVEVHLENDGVSESANE